MGKVKRKSVARTARKAASKSTPSEHSVEAKSPPAAGPLSPEKKRAFLEAYAGRSVMDAAKLVGTSHVSVFKAARLDPEFNRAYRLVRDANIDTIEDRLFQAALTDQKINFPAVIATLNAHRAETYRQNMRVEHSGSVATVTPELLREARERAARQAGETKH